MNHAFRPIQASYDRSVQPESVSLQFESDKGMAMISAFLNRVQFENHGSVCPTGTPDQGTELRFPNWTRFRRHLGHPRNSAQDARVIAGRQTAHKGASMTAQDRDHDKARGLAEKALDKLVEGDEAAGDKLIKQAEKIDPTAIDEVAEDLDISDEDIEQAQDSARSDA